MVRAGERAYVYAKACGVIGKSFVGRRMAALSPVSRLSELDRLVFAANARELPERELLPDIERRIIKRSVDSVSAIAGCFANPPELLRLLVQSYEYADLKTALTALEDPAPQKPDFTDIGRFQTIHFEAWPDLEAMLKGTDYTFVLETGKKDEAGESGESAKTETSLDSHYYRKLWNALFRLKKTDRRAAEKIIRREIALRNASWVLRLRTYYGMNADELAPRLISIPGHDELTADALKALSLPLDSRSEWENWKWEEYLNPEGAEPWRADPRYFQNAAAEKLYKLALHYFRLSPMSLDTVFCFIKLKQFEEDLLTSHAEGLGLGMSSRDVSELLESLS
jgi:vacuolar-type H+-ATPase subunit C/Vma6